MIGAIIGDIVGSRFERHNHKSKDFRLFDKRCHPTDDSIMSLAVAKAILESGDDIGSLSENAVFWMQKLGRIYRNAGYGRSFISWIMSDDPKPYNSYGNGSAMRVSPCGFAAGSIEEAKELSSMVTKVSHDHPEGMKGAEAIAVAVYLAKTGTGKEDLKKYIEENYYDLDFSIDDIRATYKFDVSCQGSVPVALEAFFESTDFEDAIRLAISVGGDSDTIAAMAGSVAEAYYGVPEDIVYDAIDFLDGRQMEILYSFEKKYPSKVADESGQASISMFDVLDEAVDKIIPEGAEMHIEEEYPDGSVRVSVDKDVMVPDFSSFDKHEGAKEPFASGYEAAKAARKTRKDLFSAVKSAVDNADLQLDVRKIAGDAKGIAKKGLDSIDVDAIKGKAADIKESVEDKKDEIEFKLKELDIQLENAINAYNEEYARMNDEGLNLYIQRTRAVDVIDNVSELVGSIANSPKSFDSDFEEINKNKLVFKGAEAFAADELKNARKAAGGAGAGIAAGAAVMSAAPTAAMWIATTFGTASTGTAISTLSGAAATNAAIAWLGGGALTAGGGGMAAGNALLALAGPLGIGIAGVSLLASIALFSRKKILNNKEKNKEIKSVKKNTASLKEITETIHTITAETITLRDELMKQFADNMRMFGADYMSLDDADKKRLGAMVNNTKALSALFSKTV